MVTTTGPARGHLLIHGGRTLDKAFIDLFTSLAVDSGGSKAKLVYIPTAEQNAKIPEQNGETGLFNGLHFTVLHTRNRRIANQVSFVSPLRSAHGVFISGGRQPRLAKAYLNTRTHHELQNLLDRGGVIAGTSAGAMIMSSFLVRGEGSPSYDNKKIVGNYQVGFGFISNIAFDVHVQQYNRDQDLAEVLKVHPGLLGVGIDADTAIHVQGNEFTVLGPGRVLIHIRSLPVQKLRKTATFDMQKRVLI